MKKLIPLFILLAASPVIAEENSGFYLGVKTGVLDIDIAYFDADTPKGIVFGYQHGTFGIELEANFADIDYNIMDSRGSTDFRSMALYGVYRSEGDIYFKGKAGILNEEIKTSYLSEDDTGFSAGIGAGAKFGSMTIEAEYTLIESNVNFFSVGASFYF